MSKKIFRYAVKRENGTLVDGARFSTTQEAENWVQEHLEIFGGLDWRVGFLFKARNDNPLEIVWSRSKKPVKWDPRLAENHFHEKAHN